MLKLTLKVITIKAKWKFSAESINQVTRNKIQKEELSCAPPVKTERKWLFVSTTRRHWVDFLQTGSHVTLKCWGKQKVSERWRRGEYSSTQQPLFHVSLRWTFLNILHFILTENCFSCLTSHNPTLFLSGVLQAVPVWNISIFHVHALNLELF